MNNTKKIKPSIAWYFVSAGVFIVGIVAAVLILISGIFTVSDSISKQFLVSETQELYLEEGLHYVYHENRTVIDGNYHEFSGSLIDLNLKITNTTTQKELTINDYNVNSEYTFNSRQGHSIFSFNVEDAGNYTIESELQENNNTVALAIGKDFSMTIIKTIAFTMVVSFISFVLAIIILILTIVKRSNFKNKLRYQAMPRY